MPNDTKVTVLFEAGSDDETIQFVSALADGTYLVQTSKRIVLVTLPAKTAKAA